ECMKEGELADRTFTPSAAVHRISYWKNQMTAVTEALRDARGPWEKKAALVYSRYEKRLRETGAVDFYDLLLLVVRLFTEHQAVLDYYRNLWRYVLVDEYQDTNRAQYRIIRLLTSEHRNVCVVGDSDQSIYKWRGADIRNILDFEDDYPGTKVIRLEQNYRSTKNVLALAAGVIAHNVQRKDKTLWTENPQGEPAKLYRAWDEHEEASFVAQSILGLRGEGVPWDGIAVFYRTNAQSRVLEDALRRGRIPYVIDQTGYGETLRQDRAPESEARLENLEELIAAAEDFTHTEAEPTLDGFLDGVALMSDVDELKDADSRVTLMTLHSAKGLEFTAVFLTGLEEGVF